MTNEQCKNCKHYVPLSEQCYKHNRHIEDVVTCSYGNPTLASDELWERRCKENVDSRKLNTRRD